MRVGIAPGVVRGATIVQYYRGVAGFSACCKTNSGWPRDNRDTCINQSLEDVMKVVVDQHLCEGNSRCSEAAPDVFEVRDDDKSHVLIERPPETLREKVKLAARLCPRQAISIIED
jgi:ferredoxin